MSLSRRTRVRLGGVILLAALPLIAADLSEGEAPPVPGSLEEVHECMERNLPAVPVKQKVRFRAIDALGSECALRTFDFGKEINDRMRAKLCVKEPQMMRGSNSLGIEASDPNRAADCWFYSPSLRKVRVCPRGREGRFMCTDFDMRGWQRRRGVEQVGPEVRLPDAQVAGRDVYAVEWTPSPALEMPYDQLRYYVDQETCVTLQEVSYDRGEVFTVLTADARKIVERGGIHVATDLLMYDVIWGSYTEAFIDEIEIDAEIRDQEMTHGGLALPCR